MPRPGFETRENPNQKAKPPEDASVNVFAASGPKPAEQMTIEPIGATVSESAPERQAHQPQSEAPRAQDDWRQYEVRKQQTDWKSYEIPEQQARHNQQPMQQLRRSRPARRPSSPRHRAWMTRISRAPSQA